MCNCSDTDIGSGNELFHAQTSSYVLVVHVLLKLKARTRWVHVKLSGLGLTY